MLMLPTLSRPHEVRELIETYKKSGETAPVHVLIDDAFNPDREHYYEVDWPEHWRRTPFADHLELSAILNAGMRLNRGAKWYGFFGDHFRPLTPFAKKLSEAAGDWFIAWPSDGDSSYRQPAGCPTFGGKLVEHLGWIMMPNCIHCCTDRVWWHLWFKLGIAKHVEDVKFTRTWPLGEGGVERPRYRGYEINAHDLESWLKWERGPAIEVVDTLRQAMIADGYSFGPDGRIDPQHGCTPFQEGW